MLSSMLNSWRLALLSPLLLLAACTTLPPESKHAHITPELMVSYQTHQQRLENFKQWQAAGKIALLSPAEKQSSRMNWQQSPQESRLTLTNMLGVTLLEAIQTPDGATIRAEGKTHKDSSLHALINQLTGFRMPVNAMPRWLTGNADLAQVEDLALDEQGYLLNFKQTLPEWGEWQISYNSYYPASEEKPALPSKITLKHPELTIKLIIHKWN